MVMAPIIEGQPYAKTTNGIPSATIFLFYEKVKLFHSNGWFEGNIYIRTFPSKRKALIFLRLVRKDPLFKDNVLDSRLVAIGDEKNCPNMSLEELIQEELECIL